jgi:hypothetical protein
VGSGGGQLRGRSFGKEVALELGPGGKDVEDKLAAGLAGSIASCGLRNPTPRSASPVTVSTRCRRDRPMRSSLQRTRVSPGRTWSRACSRTVRSVRAPLAVSVNTRAAGTFQGVDLELGLLVGGGGAGVTERMSHAAERRRTL